MHCLAAPLAARGTIEIDDHDRVEGRGLAGLRQQRDVVDDDPAVLGAIDRDLRHQYRHEYRVMKALHNTGVPVPRMLGYCTDREVLGTEFFVMEFLEGTPLALLAGGGNPMPLPRILRTDPADGNRAVAPGAAAGPAGRDERGRGLLRMVDANFLSLRPN